MNLDKERGEWKHSVAMTGNCFDAFLRSAFIVKCMFFKKNSMASHGVHTPRFLPSASNVELVKKT